MTIEDETDQAAFAWHRALEAAGLEMADDGVSLSTPQPSPAAIRVTPLLHRAWLSLEGTDAVGFLHDQLTAPVIDLGDSGVRLAAYCSAQGRVLAILRVTRDRDGLLAELPAGLAASIARRLGMFVLRADVRVRQAPRMTAVGLWGENAESLLAGRGLTAPETVLERTREDRLSVIRLPGTVPRFQVQGPADDVLRLWEAWLANASPAATSEWRSQEIGAGLADVGPATTDQFLPQSLGLESWSALSYRKGCYPGQEVIARAHYRGRLKRHLYRATVSAGDVPAGTPVSDDKGNRAGAVIEAAPNAGDRSVLLAVLHERAESGCHLAEPDGAALEDLKRLGPERQWE